MSAVANRITHQILKDTDELMNQKEKWFHCCVTVMTLVPLYLKVNITWEQMME